MVILVLSYAIEIMKLYHTFSLPMNSHGRCGLLAMNGGGSIGCSLMTLMSILILGLLCNAQVTWGGGGSPAFMRLCGVFGVLGIRSFFIIKVCNGNHSWWNYHAYGGHGMKYGMHANGKCITNRCFFNGRIQMFMVVVLLKSLGK